MEKIKSISEAYSMQPVLMSVMKEKAKLYGSESSCKEIKLEEVDLTTSANTGEIFKAYVGYNFEGEKIFQYKADSENVHYGEPD